MDLEELKKAISLSRNFPTLPTVVNQILSIVNDDESSVSDVAKIVSQDQTLAAKMLRLVNSAAYGLNYKITLISEAIGMLGYNKVATLSLNAMVLDTFQMQKFDMEGFWQHTIATSAAAKFFAERLGIYGGAEMAATLGLVHDIGKLFFMIEMPDQYQFVLDEIKESGQISQIVERRILGVDHCQAGLLLAKHWDWPKSFQDMIFYHHYPHKVPVTPTICYCVYLGNMAAHAVMEDLYDNITLPSVINPILAKKPDFPEVTPQEWDEVHILIRQELSYINNVVEVFS